MALSCLGAASANAWTWAWSTSPDLVYASSAYRGGGYGNFVAPDQYHIQTNTYLSDRSADGMRTYAELKTYSRNGSIPLIPEETGRRSDGQASYARMADPYTSYSFYPNGVYILDFYSRVCMDKSFAPDPCATGHRHQGP